MTRDFEDTYIVSACRTPIGSHGGGFRNVRSADLSAVVANAAVERANLSKDVMQEVIWGECHQQADQCNTARVLAMKAGFPKETIGVTVNKVCTSGMYAIIAGTREIRLGETDVILAGGVESMSSAPYVLRTARWGQKLQHGVMSDTVWEGFTCGISGQIMGQTAENLVEKHGISREEQDAVALRSQRNACAAIDSGRFTDEIVPVPVPGAKGTVTMVDTDEHPRRDVTAESLAHLKPLFKDGGTVTAGNSSGINDGAAALVLMSSRRVRETGAEPLARIVDYAFGGVEAELMGYGPVPAVEKLLSKTDVTLDDIGLVEVNEAFAGQYLAVEKLLGLDRERTNVNGSGISLGHPVGCTGARIVVTLVHEMIRREERLGLATLCGMGGVATALLVEAV
ncbi:MAG: acetyl-CoA C-acetyltransferase [Alphaproteobacteria bacterium]|nr:acetyl-CoA C-acetyltransferase [Alphaproteobacteria bacterium]